ncbi:MAG: NAD-dependent epimerase/dehydratase family protein, partial [Clostridia bacterium]|nr:NAD-dependent epimerase/dehydratase family protein [Clostridia bacterium]
MKKALILGGTGVMGTYLTQYLYEMGFKLDVLALDEKESKQNLTYIKANAKDKQVVGELLKNDYDAVIDFMMYNTKEFADTYKMFLDNTEQYVFLSSYRIYADDNPIRETSPRLLDVSPDKHYLASDDYSLYKARSEDLLINSGKKNWTAVRPTITYSDQRLQLVTLEGNTVINRSRQGKPVVLPKEALKAQTTMSFAGDVSKMIARLVLNKDAYGEAYTTATAEHQSWETIADYYKEIIGLKYIPVDMDDFLSIRSDEEYDPYRWKLIYDRVYDRVIDNTKILNATGMKQSELMPVKEGLTRCIAALDSS